MLAPGIEDNGEDDDQTGDDAFGGFGGTDLGQPGFERGNDENTEEAIDDGTATTHEAGATDDHGGNGGKFEAGAGIGVGGAQARRIE